MTGKRATMLVALMIAVAFVLVALPAEAQVREQPTVRPGPTLQVDPRILQRPQLQLRGPEIQFRAKFDDRLLERASGMNLYRLQESPLNAEMMRGLGERLGMGGEPVQSDGMVGMMGGDAGFMMLDPKMGRLVFNVNLAELVDDEAGRLPSDREAGAIAMKFLRDNELMPDMEQALVAHVGHINSASFDPNANRDSGAMVQATIVHFARHVDGFRVVGDGSKAVVQIGDGGAIAGGGVEWRALGKAQKLSPEQLLNTEAVMANIQSKLRGDFGMAKNILVDRVGLFYYDRGGFMQPCVGFQAQVTSGEFSYSYFGQVALMQKPPVLVGLGQLPPEAREMLKMGERDLKPDAEAPGD